MLPTLELQDRILVEKIRPKLAQQRHQPALGRVVVFSVPSLIDAGYDPNTALIKRVVGAGRCGGSQRRRPLQWQTSRELAQRAIDTRCRSQCPAKRCGFRR